MESSGAEITLIEKTNQWKPAGYVIGLWYNGIEILKDLNIYGPLEEKGHRNEFQETTDEYGTRLRKTDFAYLNNKYGTAVQFLHRKDLHEVLRNHTSRVQVNLGTTLKSVVERDDDVEVVFSNDTRHRYDLVIGADGINSQVRSFIFNSESPIIYDTEYMAFIAELSEVCPRGNIEMLGTGKIWGYYPISETECGIFASMRTDNCTLDEAPIDRLRSTFQNFGGYVPKTLRDLSNSTPIYSDSIKEVELQRWHTNRIILIGDAAHAMLPTTGQGVSAAIEDGYELGKRLFVKNQNHGFSDIFREFEKQRRAKIAPIQKRSRIANHVVMSGSRIICAARDALIKYGPRNSTTTVLDKFFRKQ